MRIDPNDPRLTAYALGELEESEKQEFEKLLEGSEEGYRLVEEFRALGLALSTELAKEPEPVLAPAQRRAIEDRLKNQRREPASETREPSRSGFWSWRIQPYRLAAAVTACLALCAGLYIESTRYVGQVAMVSDNRPPMNTTLPVTELERQSLASKEEVAGKQVAAGVPAPPPAPVPVPPPAPVVAQAPPLGALGIEIEEIPASQNLSQFQVASSRERDVKLVPGERVGGEIAKAAEKPATASPMRSKTTDFGTVHADWYAKTGDNNLGRSLNEKTNLGTGLQVPEQEALVEQAKDRSLPVQNPITGGLDTLSESKSQVPSLGQVANEKRVAALDLETAEGLRRIGYFRGGTVSQAKPAAAKEKLSENVVSFSLAGEQKGDQLASDAGYYVLSEFGRQERKDLAYVQSTPPVPEATCPPEPEGTEAYNGITDNPFKRVSDEPLSTFSIDVDTAGYSNLRRFLNQGTLPPKDAIRIEEMINYFPYDYAPPTGEDPFAAHVEAADCPWNPQHRLIRIGLKGKEVRGDDRAGCNLVFLIDVSGSMEPANKLPLLKSALQLLLNQLQPQDRVTLVTYAGTSGLALPSTPCTNKPIIAAAIDKLRAGGSTNGASGIQLAYSAALQNFIEHGVNRVILATDGDFNVGVTSPNELTNLITDKAKSGVFLSVLGFGMGNLKDGTLESLADKGNGNYAYIDTLQEARKVLVEQMAGTLVTIAKDVKIQIEFNPGKVGAYRLIGYENRVMAAQDFNDDRKDAGEIGAGHTVTALYEVVPVGVPMNLAGVDPLKYQKPVAAPPSEAVDSPETLNLRLRYKQPDGDTSKLLEIPITDNGAKFEGASIDFKFASAVASFGMILRDSPYRGSATFETVRSLAQEGKGADNAGYRAEFAQLVGLAKALKPN
jgi:Ca-activated chloride channel family protein